MANSHSFSLVPRGHSWSPVCTIRYNRVQHLHEQTAFLTIIFKTLRLIRLTRILSYEPGAKAANSKALPRANCVTIQLTVRAWSHESGWPGLSGWLALPSWLLSRYFMKRASPEPLYLLYRDWTQCAWAVCYPLSCFSLGSFAGSPDERDYLENFHPRSRHHNTGIPANLAGSVVI